MKESVSKKVRKEQLKVLEKMEGIQNPNDQEYKDLTELLNPLNQAAISDKTGKINGGTIITAIITGLITIAAPAIAKNPGIILDAPKKLIGK